LDDGFDVLRNPRVMRKVNHLSLKKKGSSSRCWVQALLAFGLLSLSLGFVARLCGSVGEPSEKIHTEQVRRSTSYRTHRSVWGGDARRRQLSFTDDSNHQWLDEMGNRLLLAQEMTDPVEQRDALKACLDGLTPEMAASLLAMMDSSELKGLAAAQLFDLWLMTEPANAATWAGKLEDMTTMSSFMNLVALRWAVSDLEAAVSWVHKLPDGSIKNELVRTIGSEAVRSDPQEALRLAAELPEDSAQADLVCRAASEWAVSEPDAAKEWAKMITDESLRERVMQGIALSYAEKNPVAAVSVLLDHTAEGPVQDRAIVSIIQSWAGKDPLTVSTWVKQFPDDCLGKDAVTNMIQIWASSDLQAAADWLLGLPASQMKNEGMLAYARVVRRTDTALANHWESRMKQNP
jgi:hypothetical protein